MRGGTGTISPHPHPRPRYLVFQMPHARDYKNLGCRQGTQALFPQGVFTSQDSQVRLQ